MMYAKFIKITQTTVFCFSLLLFACNDNPVRKVDVKEMSSVIELQRFDNEFFALDTSKLEEGLKALKNKYPDFYDFYREDIMGWSEDEMLQFSRVLLTDSNVLKLQDTLGQVFGDFSEQINILDPAFKRFHYFFPEFPTPKLVLAYTEFLFRTGTDSQTLVLPLEMYLGKGYPVYFNMDIPEYMIRRMDKHHLPTVAMMAWFDQCFEGMPAGRRFLDQIIKEGKQLYYLQSVLPESPDTLITGWTGEQLTWLNENEYQIWTFFISEKYLYSTDGAYYMPLLTDGPFTAAPNVPPGSAPRIGAFAGWQIVKNYMKKNPDITLMDLFQEMDADKILNESGYRP